MSTPTVKAGDAVLYMPHLGHCRDTDHRGDHVFHFTHVKDGPMRAGKPSARAGERVLDMGQLGALGHADGATWNREAGYWHTAGGHVIKPDAPKFAWKAIVMAVGEDGRCDLRIEHPRGGAWLDYPSVPYSADGALHSWHLPEGA